MVRPLRVPKVALADESVKHGRIGDAPPRLRGLIDAGDELEDELNKLKESGDLTESGGSETRHVSPALRSDYAR